MIRESDLMNKGKYLLLAVMLACLLAGCGRKDPMNFVSKECEIDLSGGRILSEKDTHGGFHNDGCRQIVIQLAGIEAGQRIQASGHWHPLPLPEPLSQFLYQPNDDGWMIPEVEKGFFFFLDRHSERVEPYEPAAFIDRNSYNFSAAILDLDTNRLYYVQYDS